MNEKIQQEARNLLDSFAKSLAKTPAPKPTKAEKQETSRQESQIQAYPNLKQRILANAPNKDQDSIIAEKANW